jgi:hypothetical protein
MNPDFSSYEAYQERYRMFWSEEGDGRPPMLDRKEFQRTFAALRDSYEAYEDLVQMAKTDQAARYYANVINELENRLAIADASDNFRKQVIEKRD